MKVKVWLSGQIIDASGNVSNLWVIEADNGFRQELIKDPSITSNDIISQIKSGQIQIPQQAATQPQTEGEIDI